MILSGGQPAGLRTRIWSCEEKNSHIFRKLGNRRHVQKLGPLLFRTRAWPRLSGTYLELTPFRWTTSTGSSLPQVAAMLEGSASGPRQLSRSRMVSKTLGARPRLLCPPQERVHQEVDEGLQEACSSQHHGCESFNNEGYWTATKSGELSTWF